MRTGEHMHMVLRVVQCVFYVIITILSILLFIFTLTQKYDPNAGSSVQTGVEDYYGSNKPDTPCSQTDPDDYAGHWPLRFARPDNSNNTESGNRVYEYCGWKDTNVTYRGVISFLMIPLCIFMFERLRRRTPATSESWLMSKPKRTMKFTFIPCIAAVLVFIVMIAIDAAPLATSYQWCTGALTDKYAGTPDAILCQYDPFIAIILLEVFVVVGWGISVLFIALRIKFFIQYMELDESEETDMSDVPSRKSKFSFAKNKNKSRGRH